MGRIVIPRPRASRRPSTQINRVRKSGYFANGFGPQEMSLISKLTDLAVAGGGQIARAVQISNREEEQAEAQAEYDQRLQANAEERRAAAQGLVDATDIDGQVEAFFAQQEPPSVRERLPSMSGMNLQSDLVQPRPMRGGVLSPGVLARPGLLAPEDARQPTAQELLGIDGLSMLNARAQRPAPEDTRPPLAGILPGDLAQRTRLPGLRAAYQNALGRGDVNTMGRIAREMGGLPSLGSAYPAPAATPDLPSLNEASPGMSLPGAQPTRLQFQRPFSAADEYGSMQRRAEREQEMQGRDFRQEAVSGLRDPNDPTIEAIGPAPEAKPFRIADILAQASSARTAEQRAMLLQAAADSPDIQAANLSDLAKGAYRDRAMKTVMKLFPKEDKEMSKLDRARYDQITARTELVDLQRKNLEQKMGDVSKAKSISPVVRRTRDPETGDDFDSFVAWTEHVEDKDAKRGQFSDDAIFIELTAQVEQRAAQEGRQPTQQEMSFNAADVDRGRREKFNRLVGRYSDATPDTILGFVAKAFPGRRQKPLRKTVLDMVGKVGDREEAEAGAARKSESAEVQSDLIQNRQLIVGAARAEDKSEAAETAHGYKKEIIGIKDKNTQRNIAVKHNNTLNQLSKRIELTEAMRSRLAAQNQKAQQQLVALKASIKPQAPNAQAVSLKRQRVKYVAAKTASRDPVLTAYYNTYIKGINSILAEVEGAPAPAPAQQAQPTDSVYDATTNTTQ